MSIESFVLFVMVACMAASNVCFYLWGRAVGEEHALDSYLQDLGEAVRKDLPHPADDFRDYWEGM